MSTVDGTLQDTFDKNALQRIKQAIGTDEESNILDILEKASMDTVQNASADVLAEILTSLPSSLKNGRRDTIGFIRRNFKSWSTGFDLLEALSEVCTEAGSVFNKRYRPIAVENDDYVFEAVVRLHARACQISKECIHLLIGGYADGAHARWRALHEVAATACFVQKHGTTVAKQYLQHVIIEAHKARLQINEFSDRTNMYPFTEEEIKESKLQYDAIVDLYGQEFKSPYGWAANTLNYSKPNFSDIERDVKLDHIRPYYKWASQNVHAGSKGLGGRLGGHFRENEVLLVGASDSGLTDPADAVGLSLLLATVTLLSIKPDMDDLVAIKVASEIQSRVGPEFIRIDPYNEKDSEDRAPHVHT